MAKHLHRKDPALDANDAELDMTPMIDVTFLLLIFFMCTLKFKTLEGRLSAYLPNDVGQNDASTEASEPIDIGIHVRVTGTKYNVYGAPWTAGSGQRWDYGDDRRVDYSLGPVRGLDLAGVQARLAGMDSESLAAGVCLNPGEGTLQAEAIAMLDTLLASGITEVRIAGAR
ncbi:MAG: hypothetical protein ACI9F9_000791 [Candidatus Paceibacteria bacterium]|jgi:hypothetical protein